MAAGANKAQPPTAETPLQIRLTPQQARRIKALQGLNLVNSEPTPFVRHVVDERIAELASQNGMTVLELDRLASKMLGDNGAEVWVPDPKRKD